MAKLSKSKVLTHAEVVRFSAAKEKYDYKALLRGYEELFDSKLRQDFAQAHQTEVMFASTLSRAMDFYNTVNAERGWSKATQAELAKMERLCKRMDEMLKQYAPFFDRQKILDVGRRILNQEFMGQSGEAGVSKGEQSPVSLKEFKARRAGGMR